MSSFPVARPSGTTPILRIRVQFECTVKSQQSRTDIVNGQGWAHAQRASRPQHTILATNPTKDVECSAHGSGIRQETILSQSIQRVTQSYKLHDIVDIQFRRKTIPNAIEKAPPRLAKVLQTSVAQDCRRQCLITLECWTGSRQRKLIVMP